jgi:hypothetical protein
MNLYRLLILFILLLPAVAAADEDAAIDALRQLHEAVERLDADAVVQLLHAEGEPAPALLRAMAELLVAGRAFTHAADERFGESAQAVSAPMFDRRDLPRLEAAEVRVRGETATVLMPGQPRPIYLERHEGRWRVRVTHHTLRDASEADRQAALLRQVGEVLAGAAQRLSAGEFDTAEAAAEHVERALHAVMIKHYEGA